MNTCKHTHILACFIRWLAGFLPFCRSSWLNGWPTRFRNGQVPQWSGPAMVRSYNDQVLQWPGPAMVRSRNGQVSQWSGFAMVRSCYDQVMQWSGTAMIRHRNGQVMQWSGPAMVGSFNFQVPTKIVAINFIDTGLISDHESYTIFLLLCVCNFTQFLFFCFLCLSVCLSVCVRISACLSISTHCHH